MIPGTDGALACAIAHVILTKGLWNKKFVGDFKQGPWNYELTDNYNNKANLFKAGETVNESKFEYNQGYGLVRWWNLALKDAAPEWAADICGVEAKVITEVATQFGKYGDASCSWQSPGTNMQVRGVYGAMAANALNGLVGSIETKGGVFRSAAASTGKLPDHNHFRDSNARKAAKMKAIDGRIRKDFLNYNGKAIHSNETSSRLADVILQEDGHYEDGSYEMQDAYQLLVQLLLQLHWRAALRKGVREGAFLREHHDDAVGVRHVRRHPASREALRVRALGLHQGKPGSTATSRCSSP